ncbi:hypothetical protein [Maribacter sp. 4G9]|uniref:hypothetical protein n=1 Tax=Maribacter sp. 4G9 TaxID=1889777 RepID=UPI000F5031DF|nr:hypothetical protein [Maribacter sp. 4G9]
MKLRFFLFFLCMNLCALQGQDFNNAAKHVGAGVVIGGVGGYAASKIFPGQRGWTWAGAVGSSLAAGLAKETYDKTYSGLWQTDDVLYTTLGGVISGLALELLLKNTYRRNGRSGKGCGCLVADGTNYTTPIFIPIVKDKSSGNIQSEIQVSYFLE